MVLRIALLYYLLDPPLTRQRQGIGPEHLDAAMAVWDCCSQSVELLFGDRAGTNLGDKILALLANGPKTKAELNKHLSPSQKHDRDGALAALKQQGLIVETERSDTGGRPATAWELAK
jgi:hypothetical protein